jgi:hypothetical protein
MTPMSIASPPITGPSQRLIVLVVFLSTIALAACGKSSEQVERENAVRQAAMQKTLADSIAEEREKDRRMREGASAQANERIARESAAHELEVAAAAAAGPTPEQLQAGRADALRKYTDKLKQSLHDPGSVQVRRMELSPKQNGMCAEINAKPAGGSYAGFKRVVVTDSRVAVEEPPLRDTLNEFLLFQIAARDTGCFPDVEKLRLLQ